MPASPIDQVVEVVENLFFKVKEVLSTVLGWFLMSMTFALTLFGSNTVLIHWVIAVLFIDLGMGCWSSIKLKKFHISYALTSTAIKLVMYIIIFCMPLIIDKIIPMDLSMITIAVTILLCSAEFFSVLAHMLIIKPDLAGVKLVRRMLLGEISKKIGCTPDEVESYLK